MQRSAGAVRLTQAAGALVACLATAELATSGPKYDQSALTPLVNQGDKVLQFDWPTLQIGTGEYAEGPTGVTVIRFTKQEAYFYQATLNSLTAIPLPAAAWLLLSALGALTARFAKRKPLLFMA